MPIPSSYIESDDTTPIHSGGADPEIVLLRPDASRRPWRYGAEDRPWTYPPGSVVRDRVSRLLALLVDRLKSSPSASREAELRHYGVPLAEVFKTANAEYPSVSINEDVMAGAPCIAETRIPVYMVLDAIETEGSIEMVQRSYPTLSVQQIREAIGFAKVVVECPIEHETSSADR